MMELDENDVELQGDEVWRAAAIVSDSEPQRPDHCSYLSCDLAAGFHEELPKMRGLSTLQPDGRT